MSSPGDPLPSAPREALERFASLLLRWNRSINLVGRGDEHALWERHIGDSLHLVPLIPRATDRAIDLGSGAGFPGIVLALVTGIPFTLVEADQRKATFLAEARRVTGAPIAVYRGRIETADIPPAPLVTARAVAPLPRLLDLVAPKLMPGGIALLPKGERAAAELTAARRGWQMNVVRIPGRTPGTVVLKISELHPVADRP